MCIWICVFNDCSLLHGKLANSFARNWLAKKCALQLSTRLQGVAKSLAVFTWVKVCTFNIFKPYMDTIIYC